MASSSYLYSIFPKLFSTKIKNKFKQAKHPYARTCAGLMGILSVLSVLIPVMSTSNETLFMNVVSIKSLSVWTANLGGLINLISFTLSYYALFQATKDTQDNHEHGK